MDLVVSLAIVFAVQTVIIGGAALLLGGVLGLSRSPAGAVCSGGQR